MCRIFINFSYDNSKCLEFTDYEEYGAFKVAVFFCDTFKHACLKDAKNCFAVVSSFVFLLWFLPGGLERLCEQDSSL